MIIPAIIFDIACAIGVQCDALLNGQIHELILHGPYAQGKPRKNSDLNILLSLNCAPEDLYGNRQAIAPLVNKFSLQYHIAIHVELITKEQFRTFSRTIPKYMEIAEESFRYTRLGLNLPNWEAEEYDY